MSLWSFLLNHRRVRGVELDQRLQQVVLSINQHAVGRTRTASMPQNSRRRRISFVGGRQIAINQRLIGALCVTLVCLSLVRILGERSKLKQAAGGDGCRRSVTIAIHNSFIAEVVPGHVVLRQSSDDVVCDFLRCLQKLRIPGLTIRSSKSVEGPSRTARPTRLPGISLMSVIEDALTWFCIIRKYEAALLFIPAELKLLTVVARVVMNRLDHR